MALEREWLTDQARRERDAMGRSVQYTETEYWEKDSVLPGWLNRDLIAHLAGDDGAAAALVGGDLRVPYLLQSRIVEWWLHGEDLRAGADLAPRGEHPPIFCVNDLAVRMIPYGLSLAGLSFPGKSIRVDLEGAGGGRWHYGLAPHETPHGSRPDTVVEGRGYPFAMVAGGRIAAGDYLSSGGLQLGGDLQLGRIVLDHLRVAAA